ncbi:SMI1 / KNR4 family (SUKH-1) [Chitinophaga jiangningensis]|uniref:SMI1 / KNR4 family (SUKH-1) n=1 Tax=Chitinophaga jiangningensis TaxID=1419482 RepID=A0A1M7CXX6_9BACT|nr:SMI1/KNR4 family protein [Chitinophaga jiangningensis]SHL72101.1 SMI1 / KNR4 family (SUKH-1) [Chitinophaga jiangningensis]
MIKNKKLQEIIDIHLQACIDNGLNIAYGEIESEMASPVQDSTKEYRKWLPIKSEITEDELQKFEEELGHKLPTDYKAFLQHKHFYELYISEASFCKHPVNKWNNYLKKMILDGWPHKYLIDKGYVHFADWSDWGALCFDTNRKTEDNNYPVVLWDHDRPLEIQEISQNFTSLILKLDNEHEETQKV